MLWSKRIDNVLKYIMWPLKSSRKKIELNDPTSILILDFHMLGDIVMLTSLLIGIRNKHPRARIGLVAQESAKVVLKNHPNLYDLHYVVDAPWVSYRYTLQSFYNLSKLLYRLRKSSWDWGIEVRGDLRQILFLRLCLVTRRIGFNFTGGEWMLTDVVTTNSNHRHIVDHHNQILNYLYPAKIKKYIVPKLWLSITEQAEVRKSISYIGLHLGASLPLRKLPKEKSLELLDVILENTDETILLFQSYRNEKLQSWLFNNVDILYKNRLEVNYFELRQFIAQIAKCSVFIGLDSFGGHVAAALNVPVLSVFGPAFCYTCQPLNNNVSIISIPDDNVSCRGCDQVNCTNAEFQYCYKNIDFNDKFRTELISILHSTS